MFFSFCCRRSTFWTSEQTVFVIWLFVSNEVRGFILSACMPVCLYLSVKAALSGVVSPCWFSAPCSAVDPAAECDALVSSSFSWSPRLLVLPVISAAPGGPTVRHLVSGSYEKHFSPFHQTPHPLPPCATRWEVLYISPPTALMSFPPLHTHARSGAGCLLVNLPIGCLPNPPCWQLSFPPKEHTADRSTDIRLVQLSSEGMLHPSF